MLSQTIINCKRQFFLVIIFLLELSLWRVSTWLEVCIMQEPQLLLMFYALVQKENSSVCFLGVIWSLRVGLSNWGAHDLSFCCAVGACVGSDGCGCGCGYGCGCGGFYLVFPWSDLGAHDIEVGIVQKPLWRRWWWWWGKAPAADQANVSLSVTDNRVMSTSLLLLLSLLYVTRWKVWGFMLLFFGLEVSHTSISIQQCLSHQWSSQYHR